MPTKVTACTRQICRIGSSNIHSISTKYYNGQELGSTIYRDRMDLTKALKEIVKTASPDVVYVDIGMPLPLLEVYELISMNFRVLGNVINVFLFSICNKKLKNCYHFAIKTFMKNSL